jgi:glycosyltransferase involved in cell wall biosynthesis
VTRVSVGVPVYNAGGLLVETLRSIQAQTLQECEVVISIDGGDTGSLAVCEPFLADPRFRLVQQARNLGWPGNHQWLMDTCTAEFFCYWQQDDLAASNYLAELLAGHDEHPGSSVTFCDVQWFGELDYLESIDSITGTATERLLQFAQHQHWIPLRGLTRTVLIRQVPSALALSANSPFDCGFVAALASLAPMFRVASTMYFKRRHQESWSSKFHLRPEEHRRRDWLIRGTAMANQLVRVTPALERDAALLRLLSRFALPAEGLYFDFVDAHPEALRRFVEDWAALGAQLPSATYVSGLPEDSPLKAVLQA